MSEENILAILTDIRNWIRASSYISVKVLLEKALPDAKTRTAYQMSDGQFTMEQIRVKCKMSPNAIVALTRQCTSMGLMDLAPDNRRRRLFDLNDFGLLQLEDNGTKNGKNKK